MTRTRQLQLDGRSQRRTWRRRLPGTVAKALAALALACCATQLLACAPTPDEAIRHSLTEKLDGIKNADEAFLTELQADMDVERFSEYGIEGLDFMRAYLEGFDYTIDSIDVDESTAAATVTLTSKSFSQYQQRLTESAQELVGDSATLASLSNDEVNARYGEIILQSLDGLEVAPTQPIVITYELHDDTWEPTRAIEYEVSSALLTN